MRFDLLDEYSTLVPFRLGITQNRVFRDSAIQSKAAKRGTIAIFAGYLIRLRKLLGALHQTVLSRYRNLAAKYFCPS